MRHFVLKHLDHSRLTFYLCSLCEGQYFLPGCLHNNTIFAPVLSKQCKTLHPCPELLTTFSAVSSAQWRICTPSLALAFLPHVLMQACLMSRPGRRGVTDSHSPSGSGEDALASAGRGARLDSQGRLGSHGLRRSEIDLSCLGSRRIWSLSNTELWLSRASQLLERGIHTTLRPCHASVCLPESCRHPGQPCCLPEHISRIMMGTVPWPPVSLAGVLR